MAFLTFLVAYRYTRFTFVTALVTNWDTRLTFLRLTANVAYRNARFALFWLTALVTNWDTRLTFWV
jgi:hypothetical protein